MIGGLLTVSKTYSIIILEGSIVAHWEVWCWRSSWRVLQPWSQTSGKETGMGFWNIKCHLHLHTPSNNVTLPYPSNPIKGFLLLPGDYPFKYCNLCGSLFKILHSNPWPPWACTHIKYTLIIKTLFRSPSRVSIIYHSLNTVKIQSSKSILRLMAI